ncbi:MAG: hypothetical protein U5N86_05085 [Planctomycetota bacterium]|nr:hypothetical protein [Planctomycetota bacterium]
MPRFAVTESGEYVLARLPYFRLRYEKARTPALGAFGTSRGNLISSMPKGSQVYSASNALFYAHHEGGTLEVYCVLPEAWAYVKVIEMLIDSGVYHIQFFDGKIRVLTVHSDGQKNVLSWTDFKNPYSQLKRLPNVTGSVFEFPAKKLLTGRIELTSVPPSTKTAISCMYKDRLLLHRSRETHNYSRNNLERQSLLSFVECYDLSQSKLVWVSDEFEEHPGVTPPRAVLSGSDTTGIVSRFSELVLCNLSTGDLIDAGRIASGTGESGIPLVLADGHFLYSTERTHSSIMNGELSGYEVSVVKAQNRKVVASLNTEFCFHKRIAVRETETICLAGTSEAITHVVSISRDTWRVLWKLDLEWALKPQRVHFCINGQVLFVTSGFSYRLVELPQED